MAILSRAAILAAPDAMTETVAVPEWGGEVVVKSLSGAERDQFEASVLIEGRKRTRVDVRNLRAKLVSLAVVDEAGQLVFSESDVEALGQKSARALQRVFEVAQRLSGLADEDIEELTKN